MVMVILIVLFSGNLRLYCIHNLTSIIILACRVFPILYIGAKITSNVEKYDMTNKRLCVMVSTIRAQMATDNIRKGFTVVNNLTFSV